MQKKSLIFCALIVSWFVIPLLLPAKPPVDQEKRRRRWNKVDERGEKIEQRREAIKSRRGRKDEDAASDDTATNKKLQILERQLRKCEGRIKQLEGRLQKIELHVFPPAEPNAPAPAPLIGAAIIN